jgi:hypothetical protein
MVNLIEPKPEGVKNEEIGVTKDDTPDYEEELADAN